MNDACRMPALLLAAWIVAMPAALAQDSERNRYFVQQMIEMAATNNEQGVAGMQRMLEQNPRPAASDPAAARAAFQRGLALFEQDALDAALGYYINPLFSIFLGAVLLGERMGRLQMVAMRMASSILARAEVSAVKWARL
jgi:hypothetical protein